MELVAKSDDWLGMCVSQGWDTNADVMANLC